MELEGLDEEWFECEGAEFLLRPLNWYESLELGGLLSKPLEDQCAFAVKTIKNWRRVEDSDGPVEFDEALIERLSMRTVVAITKHVISSNILEALVEKN